MKHIIVLALCLLVSGCGTSMFTANTKANFTMPDGTMANWESDKEHQGLEAEYDPKTGRFKIKVEKSGTPEAAIAAALQQSSEALGLLKELLPLLKAGKVP